ncbi:hypothetical protein KC19_8G109900 [Ceratodon purpureus]|uniref:Uncharacterized protein n=1 Tax=Ceratodon purpureus TaxID=3225 RepID=A0A8T0GZY6_CERPU|nr:hypothetical protein KC19_8G109900 [Ceratodon purpureus]
MQTSNIFFNIFLCFRYSWSLNLASGVHQTTWDQPVNVQYVVTLAMGFQM